MPELPLSTFLSQVVIAFTIEFDNEWERRLAAARAGRPFLVSLMMWAAVMRFVPADGTSVRALGALAGLDESALRSRLKEFGRWGYLDVEPHPSDDRPKPPWRDWNVRLTRAGKIGAHLWQPLLPVIEQRWRDRFGEPQIARLRAALESFIERFERELPDYLPVAGNLYADPMPLDERVRIRGADAGANALPALISKVLLAFAFDVESDSVVAFILGANVLRVANESGVRLRDLPALAGISKEAAAMSLGPLRQRDWIAVEADPRAARTKLVRLTKIGKRVQRAFAQRLASVEENWKQRFGEADVAELRAALQALLDARDGASYRMSAGLVPPAAGWRTRKPYLAQTEATLRDPRAALPHYPMILHRGGWPDGC